MKTVKVVILGSGATAGTLCGCPTMPCFGRALARRRSNWREVYPVLARAVADSQGEKDSDKDMWDLSEVWTRLDYYAKLREALGTWDYGAEASCQLHRAVLDVYGPPADKEIAELLDSGQPFTLLEVIDSLEPGDFLVSFNWDVVAERIAERRGRRLVQVPHPVLPETIAFIKPHGSVSWPHLLARGVVDIGPPPGKPRTTSMSPDQVSRAEEPFLLGAVPIKSELIQEVQAAGRTNAFEVVTRQWRAFLDALRQADDLVVVGYGFPREDEYGTFLIKEAIRQRQAGPVRAISFYEKKGPKKGPEDDLKRRLSDIFKPQSDPTPKGEVTSPSTSKTNCR